MAIPGADFLAQRDRVAALDQTMSASGARYAAMLDYGDSLAWNQGDEATFQAPGAAGSLSCTLGCGR